MKPEPRVRFWRRHGFALGFYFSWMPACEDGATWLLAIDLGPWQLNIYGRCK